MKNTAVMCLSAMLVAIGGCAREDTTAETATPVAETETTISDQMRESEQAAARTTPAADPMQPTGGAAAGGETAALSTQQHSATGTVTEVDTTQGKLTLAHDPVASLEWPAMTMSFEVEDATLLRDLEAGDEVRFSFVQGSGGSYVIRQITLADDAVADDADQR